MTKLAGKVIDHRAIQNHLGKNNSISTLDPSKCNQKDDSELSVGLLTQSKGLLVKAKSIDFTSVHFSKLVVDFQAKVVNNSQYRKVDYIYPNVPKFDPNVVSGQVS